MTIEYYQKNVYGKELLYVKDKKLSDVVFRLTGKKTIDNQIIEALKALGCKFIQVLP